MYETSFLLLLIFKTQIENKCESKMIVQNKSKLNHIYIFEQKFVKKARNIYDVIA